MAFIMKMEAGNILNQAVNANPQTELVIKFITNLLGRTLSFAGKLRVCRCFRRVNFMMVSRTETCLHGLLFADI